MTQVTTFAPDVLRSDIFSDDATTVVVEVFADEAVTTATERARQGPADEDDDESGEATTSSSGGSSATRIRPNPSIPQPFANASDFLAEYQYSSQFNLGPKDEAVPLAPVSGAAVAPVPQNSQVASQPNTPVVAAAQPAAVEPPSFPPAVPQAAVPANPTSTAVRPDEEDEADSEETDATETNTNVNPAIRQQQQEQQDQLQLLKEQERQNQQGQQRQQQPQQNQVVQETPVVEESDSDNEITNDDITTVKSFASEYEYTVQQLGNSNRVPS